MQPKIQQEMLGFEAGTADYQSVYDDLNSTELEAKSRTKQMGSGAVDYYNERIKPEIDGYMSRLTREQKSGRSQFGMTAAQFDVGGRITGFGSLATYGDHGFVHTQKDEFIVQQGPAADHYGALQAIRAGASHADTADYYGGGGGSRMPVQTGDTHHYYIDAIDTQSGAAFIHKHRHDVRSAHNQSYAENSGGSDSPY